MPSRAFRSAAWTVMLVAWLLMSASLPPILAAAESPPPPAPAPSAPPATPAPAPAAAKPATPVAPKTVDDLKGLEAKIKAAVTKALPCTVAVQIGNSQGSGVIVSEDGLVMTAGHVVGKPGQAVLFHFADGKTAKGTTLGMYLNSDAGMMKITDAGKWPFLERGNSATVQPGDWCLAIGHPLGYQSDRPPVVRAGRVLRTREGVIQSDCTLVGGDSGGPLLDLDGRVIGINSRIGGPADVNLHVPIDVFRENWDRLVKGDSWQDDIPGRNSKEIKDVLRQVVAQARQCTVRVKCDGQEAVLGTIVGPDGWIVTKASELKGKVLCRLSDSRELEAKVVGVSEQYDMAMLKVDAAGLPLTPWTNEKPSVGQWLAAPGPEPDPIAVGVLSVPQRRIPPTSGVLGISLKTDVDTEARIDKVFPSSPAEKAGLKDGDVVTHVDGKPTKSREELIAAIRLHKPGDAVRLNVKRGEKILAVPVKLGTMDTPDTRRRDMQNRSGVGISGRHDDFPVVLQHDMVLRPVDCGGPLVDLSGRVVGVNVARGGRTETYGVPTDVLLGLMYDLMSGRLNPDALAAEKKATADRIAAEAKAAADKLAAEKAAADKLAAEKKAAEEKAAADKKAAEAKAAADKAAADKKAADEKLAADKAAAEKKAAEEKVAADKAAAEKKAAEEKAAAEKKAADDKAAADKAAAEKKAADEKAAADKAAAEKKAAEDRAAADKKAAEEKAAADKAAADKAAAEKKAAEEKAAAEKKAAEEKAAQEKK